MFFKRKVKLRVTNNVTLGYQSRTIRSEFDEYCKLGEFNLIVDSKLKYMTYTADNVLIINTTVGSYCSIGNGVKIGLGIHPTSFVSTHPGFYSTMLKSGRTFAKENTFNESRAVEVGHDVWIGSNAFISDGIKVGHGAIIAAGSVVTKDVKPYEIVGGVPAKHIKYRFSENIVSQLLDLQWWNMNADFIESNLVELFNRELTDDVILNIKEFYEKYR